MSLTDKIKDSTKKLALAGVLGSSIYLSGCVVHGGPREMSNFVVQDILGLPGIEETRPKTQQPNTNFSLKAFFVKDGILYDCQTQNEIMNEYFIDEKKVYLKIGTEYRFLGIAEYR